MKSLKVKFTINPSRLNSKGLAPIELFLSYDGKRSYVRTGKFVKPTKFDVESGKVKGDKELNEYLTALKNKCYQIETAFLKSGKPLTLQNLKDRINDIESSNTLFQLFHKFDEELRGKVKSGQFTESTYIKYMQNEKYMKEYLKGMDKKDVNIFEVNGEFVNGFFNYLRTTMQNNSAVMVLSKLKKIVKFGLDFGFMETDPFLHTSFKLEKKEQINYLTEEEVNRICQLDIEDTELSEMRDIFLFSCLTGLSYIDLFMLRKRHIQKGMIIKAREKNGKEQRIPLLPFCESILAKYNNRLPIPSNQKFNKKLKEIGALAGIEKKLHSHFGRHTAATLLLNNQISMESVRKVLGHTTVEMTEHYAKMLDETLYVEMNKNLSYKFL
ncbi:Tyrosine recombinase XerD [termite gut metagenome]|uniref:Tyrosine recombinase XerD n=1 Tax=termite gut metagenome TaxID=433724 RepID=A0A5J4RII0_9ZZZZ